MLYLKKRGITFQTILSIIIALILVGVFILVIVGMKKNLFMPG